MRFNNIFTLALTVHTWPFQSIPVIYRYTRCRYSFTTSTASCTRQACVKNGSKYFSELSGKFCGFITVIVSDFDHGYVASNVKAYEELEMIWKEAVVG
jgi:hypothetical protein